MLAGGSPLAGAEPTPAEVFEKRLLPIFKSPQPSSCVQCHLAGVDLKDYILPDHEKTFRSLRDQGLIDVEKPERSKILTLIQRGSDDTGEATRVSAKARAAEHAAFAAWIKACCGDAKLRAAPKLDESDRAKPARPAEVLRHGRKDRLAESFERNVWALRFRCMGCHTEGTPQADKHVEKFGPRVAWFKKAGAEATLEYLLRSRLVNLKDPEKSLLLTKPLNLVKHEGGVKFQVGDQAYKAVRTWIEDVAAIRGDGYKRAADLPKDDGPATFGTDVWLKLEKTPAVWGDKLLQVTVYAWDAEKKSWEESPIATSDRLVWGGGKLWQHTLTLLAARDSERAKAWRKDGAKLPPGKYRVNVQVDAGGRLARDWKAAFTDDDVVGTIEVTSRWREGYGAMTVLDAGKVGR